MEDKIFRYYEFGEFRLDARRRTLFKDGENVQISSRLFDLLLALVQNEGKILEHDELLDKVWGETFVEQSNLKKGISSLRQVLGELPNQSLYIKTVPRRGYSFVASVRAAPEEKEEFFVRRTEREIIIEEIEEFDDEEVSPNEKRDFLEAEIIQPPKTEFVQYQALPAPPETRFGKRRILILCAAISLLIVLTGAFWLWRGQTETFFTRLNPENLRAQKFTTSGNVYEAGISPDGKAIVYAQVEDNGMQSLWLRRIGVPNALQLVPPEKIEYQAIVFSPDNNSIYYGATIENSRDILDRISILGGAPRRITEGIRSAASFSPDGKRFAFVRDTRGVERALLTADAEDGGNEQKIASVADNHTLISPQWSPDGAKFVFIASENTNKGRIWELKEMPAGGGEARLLTVPQRGKIYNINWLRDGSGLLMCAGVSGSNQTQLWRVSYPNGEISRLTNDVSNYETVDSSADGKIILTKLGERIGDLWSAEAANPVNPKRLTINQNVSGHFIILPGGKFLVEAVENGQPGLYAVSSGGNLQPFSSNAQDDRNPSLSADAQRVYFVSRRSGSDEIWQTDLNGGNLKQVTNEQTFLAIPSLSPDGQTLYYLKYDNTRYVLSKIPVSGGQPVVVINETVDLFDISPDGKFIAYNFRDEAKKRWQVAVLDLSNNAIVKQFDVSPSSLLRWSADGKSLFYTTSDIFREGGNLWQQSLDGGGAPTLFLNTEPDKIYSANFSPDNRQIYFTRGKTISNLVILLKEK